MKRLLLTFACLILTPLPVAAEEVPIAPHTARYVIQLLEARMGDIAFAEGEMKLDLRRDCEAWVLKSDLRLRSAQADGASFDLHVQGANREALDHSWLEFSNEVRVGGQLQEAHRGRAEIDENGRGEAVFEVPSEFTVALGEGTAFPNAAMRESLDGLFVREDRLNNFILFDGSGPSALRATDIVAGTPDKTWNGLSDPDGLTEGTAKRVVTSYFELTQTDAEPTVIFVSDVLPNGVATRLTIDLGFMVTEAQLIEVTYNEPDAC